ncbi:MAG: right-handed parallel beta-helix repeat-containing protein, partial [Armatimonadetes bacterium]|nr:right-handed parallel beta-helix repeat-containing protein [Armatimonadota bacterium]
MSQSIVTAATALLLIAPLACAAPQADFYVSTAGNDTWSGTLPKPNADGTDGPFATIERARDVVRGITGRPVTVLVRGGRYRLRRPLRFEPEDSGAEDAPVTYAAWP